MVGVRGVMIGVPSSNININNDINQIRSDQIRSAAKSESAKVEC